jgi:DNA-directed RNA polymerase subunit H (RpoH/RPB5)
MRKTKEF